MAPQAALASYKLDIQELTEDDGVLSVADRITALRKLAEHVALFLLKTFLALFTLYLKLDSLTWLFDVPMARWRRRRWLAFAAFANQIAGLVPLDQFRKEVILQFIFTGEDAVLQPRELKAMEEFHGMLVHHIFQTCSGSDIEAFSAALSISAADVQKIVIVEEKQT